MHVKAVRWSLGHTERSVNGNRPAAVPLPLPSTTWAGNSESVPQLCSKVLDAALSGDRADLSYPCVSVPQAPAASWLPAPSQGEWKKTLARGTLWPHWLCGLGASQCPSLDLRPGMRMGGEKDDKE